MGTNAKGASPTAPPGVDADQFRLALLEDTYEVIATLELVTAALALCPPDQPDAEEVTWPDSPVIRMPVMSSASIAAATLTRLHELGAEQAAVVVGDAPDLPQLLLGKLFRGLARADAAACAAEGGGLVALAARLPVAAWLAAADVDLDADDALDRLHAATPSKRALSIGPGWHRIRRPEDIGRLDPGLEGWDVTRALLSGHPW
ncbi:MAG: hypothetical protein GEV03_20085 [Streptosporangiales bacterium]|nr:hypothetical protein [Streptosporangiales bacterium]